MKEVDVLKDIGLTENESKIYLSLLQYGTSTAGGITNKTGIHRRSVYDGVDRLIEKGLVSYILTENKKYFQATTPNYLLTIIKEKERDALSIIHSLLSMYRQTEKQEVTIFKGRNGARATYEDILNTGEDYYAIATGRIKDIVGPKTYQKYIEKRVEKGITLHTIYEESMRGDEMTKMPNAVCRFMSKGFTSPINIVIYGEKLEIIIWAYDPASPLIILIKSKKVAEAFKSYFDMLWGIAKE